MRLTTILFLSILASSAFSSPAFASADDTIRDPYRHFIMPTAKAIDGAYVGFWELAFLQGGVGYDALSISGGITVMPAVAFRSQFAFVQAKLTLYDDNAFALAAGVNYLRLTSDWNYVHIFIDGTFETPSQSRFTALLFYKLSGDDNPAVSVVPFGGFRFSYGGGLGAGLGYDVPIPGLRHIRFVAEAWNHDLTSPSKLAVIGAIRLENPSFSSDFGFMFFTLPVLAPVANFVWRF